MIFPSWIRNMPNDDHTALRPLGSRPMNGAPVCVPSPWTRVPTQPSCSIMDSIVNFRSGNAPRNRCGMPATWSCTGVPGGRPGGAVWSVYSGWKRSSMTLTSPRLMTSSTNRRYTALLADSTMVAASRCRDEPDLHHHPHDVEDAPAFGDLALLKVELVDAEHRERLAARR